jgi:hypothetical protein
MNCCDAGPSGMDLWDCHQGWTAMLQMPDKIQPQSPLGKSQKAKESYEVVSLAWAKCPIDEEIVEIESPGHMTV